MRLADALLSQPGAITVELREDVRAHYTSEQALELVLDVMKWSYQKVAVSLATDAEVAPGRLTDLSFTPNGTPQT